MSIQQHKNNLKRLSKIQKKNSPSNYVSVLWEMPDGELVIPDGCDPNREPNPGGCLIAPAPVSEEVWAASFKEDQNPEKLS